eukprot:7224762-Alexandrium_andersonii.AAC.1
MPDHPVPGARVVEQPTVSNDGRAPDQQPDLQPAAQPKPKAPVLPATSGLARRPPARAGSTRPTFPCHPAHASQP